MKAAGCCEPLGQESDLRLFRALADPTRIQMLARLVRCCGPLTVSEVARCCAVDLSVVSRHLALLREAEILSVRKEGRQVFYQVRHVEFARALRRLAEAIEECCPSEPLMSAPLNSAPVIREPSRPPGKPTRG